MIFFFKQKTAYEMRISDWSSDVCASDLAPDLAGGALRQAAARDRAPAEFHSPLQGQGQQGDAGAEPRQGAGAHGAGRRGPRGLRVLVQFSGAGAIAEIGTASCRERVWPTM